MREESTDARIVQPDFGIRIKSLRRDNDLSQQDLAEQIGRSEDLVNAIERGKGLVSVDTMNRLADAFRVSVASLIDYSGNQAFIAEGGLKWKASKKPSPLIVRKQKVSISIRRK